VGISVSIVGIRPAINIQNITFIYQLLVGSVIIDIKLGREDYSSIPRNCDKEGAEIT
jgi:hypothetical protein